MKILYVEIEFHGIFITALSVLQIKPPAFRRGAGYDYEKNSLYSLGFSMILGIFRARCTK